MMMRSEALTGVPPVLPCIAGNLSTASVMTPEEMNILAKCGAPKGSGCVRIPRSESWIHGSFQTLSAFFFSSYFFFWPFFGTLWFCLGYFGHVSWTALVLFATAYFLQIALYRPHLNKGWTPFLLYSKRFAFVADYVQGYHDGTLIREGPRPDEKGKYLFAMFPHGIFGVCRAYSGGSAWFDLYGSITARCPDSNPPYTRPLSL